MYCKTRYMDEMVDVVAKEYECGGPALVIKSKQGEPLCVATVNIPDAPLGQDELLIRDWGASEGVLDFLVDNGLVEPTNVKVLTGLAAADVVKVTDRLKFLCPRLQDNGN